MLFVVLQQGLLELGKLEEPVFLAAGLLNRALAVGAYEFALFVLQEVAFVVVGFLVNAVPAFVGALVAVALVVQVLPELLNRFGMTGLGGANEIGVGDVEHVPAIAEGRLHGVAPILRRHTLGSCRVGDLLAVLVHTGNERHIVAVHALVARNRIGSDGGIGGTQVGCRVNVVNRSGEGIGSLAHAHALFLGKAADDAARRFRLLACSCA